MTAQREFKLLYYYFYTNNNIMIIKARDSKL